MSNSFDLYLQKYAEAFDEGFPTIPLLDWYGEEGCIGIVVKCLAEKKDVYQLKYLDDPGQTDVIY